MKVGTANDVYFWLIWCWAWETAVKQVRYKQVCCFVVVVVHIITTVQAQIDSYIMLWRSCLYWLLPYYTILYSAKAGGVMWSFVLSVIPFVVPSVSRITSERVNRCRPNMISMGKGWFSRCDGCRPNMISIGKGWFCRCGSFLVLISVWMWTYDRFITLLSIGR